MPAGPRCDEDGVNANDGSRAERRQRMIRLFAGLQLKGALRAGHLRECAT
jgi:hypothetical protein